MNPTVIDFETFFDKKNGISVSTQGVPRYVQSADAYIVSVVADDIKWCGTIQEAHETFNESFWTSKDRQFWSANWNFEEGFVGKHFKSPAHPGKCVLDLGAFHQLPRNLAGLAKQALGVTLDKTIRDGMDGKRYEDLSEEDQKAMQVYCLEDSIRALEIIEKLPPMTAVEEEVAALFRLRNRRGVYVDTERVDRDVTKLHKLHHEAFLKLPWRSSAKPMSPTALAEWCSSKEIPAPRSRAKTDPECTALMKAHPELGSVIESMRMFTSANKLIKKAQSLKNRLTDDGRLPLDILYAGAPHTRRGAAQGFNLLNLEKNSMATASEEDLDDAVEEEEAIWIREWFVPKPGRKFLIFDYSQIEPRCLNWLVGNDEMLEAIRNGWGIYEAFALFYKGWKGEKGTLKKTNPKLYAAAKAEVLGLGYGLGPSKFQITAAKDGLNYSDIESEHVVKEFRRNNPKIPKMWGQMDGILRNALLSKEKHFEIAMPTGDVMRYFYVQSTLKEVTLKDGTKVKKPSICTHKIKGDFRPKFSRVFNVWGGVLTENACQRMARDIMVEAMLRCEKAGFEVKWDCYDELILEIDDGSEAYLKDAMKQCEELLVQVPEWAEGLPLAVEGSIEDRYTK